MYASKNVYMFDFDLGIVKRALNSNFSIHYHIFSVLPLFADLDKIKVKVSF